MACMVIHSSRPFSESRRLVCSVKVSLTRSKILRLPEETKENLRSYPLQSFEPDGFVKIHIRKDNGPGYFFFEVHVEGLPKDADVWVEGNFKRGVRNFCDMDTDETDMPLVPCRTTWLRSNGCIGSFMFLHTQDILGTVKVYGHSEEDKLGPILDLRSLRQHTALCDVVLRAAGRDFPAHKIVLATRSPVMLTMFTSDFKEAKDKVVDITVDCSAEVFGVFVDCLYSGVVDSGFLKRMSCGDLLDLLELAERYLVADLKTQCVEQLLASREPLLVLQASLEKPYVPKECRESALRAIRADWKTILGSEEWRTFCDAHSEFALAVESMMALG